MTSVLDTFKITDTYNYSLLFRFTHKESVLIARISQKLHLKFKWNGKPMRTFCFLLNLLLVQLIFALLRINVQKRMHIAMSAAFVYFGNIITTPFKQPQILKSTLFAVVAASLVQILYQDFSIKEIVRWTTATWGLVFGFRVFDWMVREAMQ
ncbi:Hypothetical_protein [Hexamita inflata]|uniref:Hypothetical_protein n=1 Tax=Hexamita inflata TaxID=28002 RepID=A0AA86UJF9_9EUKA|nr:Hypothetical protein HINF_LOCUS41551 [Hexamita inflata]